MPAPVVDYVVVHELAHLIERNHTPTFWRIVARALPEYAERKAWLAEHGGRLL
ncbi:MAG: M48 family metallopeptidase [Chromatiales bacterium]|nr:M48 family metallopeptidase [Chromatiales bacterium]